MDVAALPLVGGHPALDLVNTVERGRGERRDHLTDPPALLTWALRAGLVDHGEARAVADSWERDPAAGPATLAAVREGREVLHRALLAAIGVEPPDPGGLERLRERWVAALGRARLAPDPGRATAARLVVGTEPATMIADRAAVGAVELLRGPDLARLRRCPPEAGGCGWLFLDRSRNGSRRWCRMADCGTTVKARRLTERRRAARAGRGAGAVAVDP
jgi:predicted RNA-binding Zn ribbon-like protein